MVDPFFQADQRTMKNRLGINNNPDLLRIAERELVSARTETVDEITGEFDATHLRAIHRYLFQDLFEWAGTMRSDVIVLEGETFKVPDFANLLSKGGSTFLPASHLDNGLAHIQRLANTPEARSMDLETFAKAATEILSDLNYAHPFREGNGRTQRVFMEQLARRAGHTLDFEGITAARNNAVSIESHSGNTLALAKMVSESLVPEAVKKRLKAVEDLNGSVVDRQAVYV